MFRDLVRIFLGCPHRRTTFPLTKVVNNIPDHTYVTCIDCGTEFAYDWKAMKIGRPILTPFTEPKVPKATTLTAR